MTREILHKRKYNKIKKKTSILNRSKTFVKEREDIEADQEIRIFYNCIIKINFYEYKFTQLFLIIYYEKNYYVSRGYM